MDATVRIDTRAESLSAVVRYDYLADESTETEIKLHLNEKFLVSRVDCTRCESFRFGPDPRSRAALVIQLRRPLLEGERDTLTISYSGPIGGMYKKEVEFIELGLDDFWFPVHRTFNGFQFRYRATVSVDDPDFELVGNGRVSGGKGRWQIESIVPDFDIDIVLGKGLRRAAYREGGYDVEVITRGLPDSVPRILLDNIRRDLEFYNSTFGSREPQRRVTAVVRPYAPIAGKGGYFRKGYFIIDNLSDPSRYFVMVAHELAHNWWLKANQQNAWLNESFAEYSAMLALRRQRGRAAFDTVLEDKKKYSTGLPAIYGFDRTVNRNAAPRVMYTKGPVKLAELEAVLGEGRFLEFLARVLADDVRTTDQLLETLARFASPEVATAFKRSLEQ